MPIMEEELLRKTADSAIDSIVCVAGNGRTGVPNSGVDHSALVAAPLSIGIAMQDGEDHPVIARDTPIPVKRSEIFTTAEDMQTSVTIHICQGERPMSSDNTSIGEFRLDGLMPAPRGVAKIELTFEIDSSGTLNVTAMDRASHMSRSIAFYGWTVLAHLDKQRMIDDAQRHSEQDRQCRKGANSLPGLVHALAA